MNRNNPIAGVGRIAPFALLVSAGCLSVLNAGSATSTSGGGRTSGATSGGTTTGGDTRFCMGFEAGCRSNSQCCSGACQMICLQPFGDPLPSRNTDCASSNCVSQQCACGPGQDGVNTCSSDADCCDGRSCKLHTFGLIEQTGECCGQVGGSCQSSDECCDGNCANGLCACLGNRRSRVCRRQA